MVTHNAKRSNLIVNLTDEHSKFNLLFQYYSISRTHSSSNNILTAIVSISATSLRVRLKAINRSSEVMGGYSRKMQDGRLVSLVVSVVV